jgi:hypothetical protein
MKTKRQRQADDLHYRLGLIDGQMRARRTMIAKNAGWYDENARKIGGGDLSAEDAVRIAAYLHEGELFIVLREHDLWDLRKQTRRGKVSIEMDSARERAPSRGFLADRACFVFAPERRCKTDRLTEPHVKVISHHGVQFDVLPRTELRKMLGLRT